MHKQFVYVDGYLMLTLLPEITEAELRSLFTTKKKTVTSVIKEDLKDGILRWQLVTVPKVVPKSPLSFFGLARRKSKTKKASWKTKSQKSPTQL